MKSIITVLSVVLLLGVQHAWAGEDGDAYAPMAMFEKLAGKSWRGEGKGPDGKPVIDIARYEMILGGRAFQSTHRLEDGSYGGRTIIFYDEGAKEYVYHYFTTAGFHTTGKIELTETGFTAVEKVNGHPKYAEVRSTVFIEEDQLRVESSHVTHGGEQSEGETLVYREVDDPGALF